MITVIGAGSGDGKQLSLAAWEHIRRAQNIILQTDKLPLCALLDENGIAYRTLDVIYEQAEDFDDLNRRIAAFLTAEQDVTYIVHGHALDDSAVALLPRNELSLLPGVSVADAAAAFCGFTCNYKVYTSSEVLTGALPDKRRDAVVTCLDSPLIACDIAVRLTDLYGDEYPVLFYAESLDGTPQKKEIALYEADKQDGYNHTACLLLRAVDLTRAQRYNMDDLLQIVSRLCAKDGCPWDSVQTHETLRPFLIEEAYEAVDAIDKDDPFLLAEELGDVLLQVVLHAAIAQKHGEFDFSDVTDAISRKMIRRHPGVFGQKTENASWDEIKMQEKGLSDPEELLRNIPQNFPSLAYAEKIQYKRALPAGTREELISLLQKSGNINEDSIGELLFEFVRFCRAHGVHPETALNKYTKSFLKKNQE